MAYFDTTWYLNSTGYAAVATRPQNTAVVAGQIVRQFTAPAVGSERCFICIVAGTTANVTDATWLITRGALTSDGTVFWQECTGAAAVNGDATNTLTWAQIKAIGGVIFAGTIIKRNNGASYQICRVGLTPGASEPAFSDTAGSSVADGAGTWVCIGSVSNFTGGQAPFARLASACATNWFTAGNTVYVGANHAESQATAITLQPAGTVATVGRIICHDLGGYPPAAGNFTTGATISTTGAVNTSFIPTTGGFYLYGLTFRSGVGQTGSQSLNLGASGVFFYCERCSFELATTGAAAVVAFSGGGAASIVLNNVTVKFANVGQSLQAAGGTIFWQNTGQVLVAGSSVPTTFITGGSNITVLTMETLDLSQLTGNITQAFSNPIGNILIKDCKLHASATVATPGAYGATVQLVRCDSGATGYKSARYAYEGTETTETAIVRTGGAVDPTGQVQSRKIVTTANAQWLRPFRAEPYAVWNPTTGANVTVTVCGTVNAGALPNNDDIWMEVEYLGSATDPLGKIVTTTKASLLASNAAVASDSSTWGNVATTLDAATAVNVTLSNGGLTATHTNTVSASGAKVAVVLSTGKYYFETLLVAGNGALDTVGGFLSVAGTFGTLAGLQAATSVGVNRLNGSVIANGINLATLGTFVSGDVAGLAIDCDARLFWARKNSGNWNNDAGANPATGTGGFSFPSTVLPASPAVGFSGTGTATNDAVTTNFATLAFAAPSGFSVWVSFVPFKLTATLSSPQPQLPGYLHARVRAAKPSTTFYIDPQVVLS